MPILEVSVIRKIYPVEKVTAFKLSAPVGTRNTFLMREGDHAKASNLLRWVPTLNKRILIGYERDGISLIFYVFLDGSCLGYVDFKIRIPSSVKSLFSTNKVATPHATMSPELQGLGYSSFIYAKALASGYTLITDEHTKEAADLWVRLSKKTGAHLGYLEPGGKVLKTPSRKAYKILSLDPTFGLAR